LRFLGFTRHDPVALARRRSEHAVVSHLVGAGRRDQRYEPFDELTSLHQNVRGAVAPAGLEAQGESSIRSLFQAIVRKRRPGDVATQALETSSVVRRNRHVCVKAHPAMLGNARRSLGIAVRRLGRDAIAEPPPPLPRVRPGGDTRSQGGCGEQGQQRLVSGERIFVSFCTLLEQPLDAAGGSGQHPR
jgi:hypothetical protein